MRSWVAIVLGICLGAAPALADDVPAPVGEPAQPSAEGADEDEREAADPELTADVDLAATGVGIRGQLDSLGSFEKRALETALARRKLDLDLAPYGKTLRKIHVVNLPVFSEDDEPFHLLNVFHITTREFVIRREVLLHPGDEWRDDVIQETRRRLTDITVTTLAVLAPVVSPEPGTVDLLVVTRDIWSLRLNSNYQIAGAGVVPIPGLGGRIVSLSISPSENNFLGLRKQLAGVFLMDLGQWSVGPRYIDPRVAGSRFYLGSQASAIFSRETGEFEGTSSSTAFSYPLWSYRREWGASLSISHRDAPIRQFQSFDRLLTYDDPDTSTVEALPRIYDSFVFSAATSATRSFGYERKSNVSLGYQLRAIRPELRDDFLGTGSLRDAFIRDVLPRSELQSAVTASYSFFTPRFITYRNIDSYSLAEDVRVGPDFDLSAALARKEIGSERNFVNLSASAGWTFDLAGDGFFRLSAGASTRIEDGDAKDNSYSASARLVPPRIFGLFRLVARVAYLTIIDNENNSVLFLGGANGLRAYDVDVYRGDTRFIGNLELRSPPLRVWFTQIGAVAFWDVGHAALAEAGGPFAAAKSLSLKSDVGAGLRMLIPQLQPFVFSFDLGYALNAPPVTPDGVRPSRFRLLLFIEQAF